MRTLIAALLLAGAAPACADAAASFRSGNWPAAIAEGRAEATPASLVLAGRAQLSVAAYQTTDKTRALALVALAERDFDTALAKAPRSVEAQLQKAIAIGYRAKLTKSRTLGKETKARMEAVKTAHPEMALAWGAIAGWHGGAVATLGSFIAGVALGAKAKEAEADFVQAIRLDPGSPVHRTFYALTLMDLDARNVTRATQVLQPVASLPARDGFDALLKQQGIQLLAALKTGDAKTAQALARRLLPFGMVA